MKNTIYLCFASALLLVSACNLEKEVDLNLPEFESKLVVECYLEIGKPYRVIVSETTGYFGSLATELPVVSGATVVITYNGVLDTLGNGVRDTLEEGVFFDFAGGKLFNYGSTTLVPEDYVNDFELLVIDSLGRTITATTKLMPKVALDSISILPPLRDSSMSFITFFKDNPAETNFYYLTTHRTLPIADSLKTAFAVDDLIINGQDNQIALGGPPVFEYGDTAIITLFQITEAYSNFIETTSAAESNNGNPFGQPGSILSNVTGGYGIFTGISYNRYTFYLK